MELSAQFCARELVLADLVRSEVDLDLHARNEVLFEAQLWDPEIMNDVLRAQSQLDRTIDRDREGRRHSVVSPGRIRIVEADKIQGAVVDELRVRATEFAVLAGVVEVPLKLLRHDLDGVRTRRRIVQSQRSPDALAHYAESDENDRRDHRPDNFETIAAVRVESTVGGGASITILPDHPAQAYLRGRERNANHHYRDKKLPVKSWSMLGNRGWKPPFSADKQQHRKQRDNPDNNRQNSSHRLHLLWCLIC